MALIACKIIEVCIFKKENGKLRFLLLHRSKTEKIYPDIWQFVSGSIENNEKAVDAALREMDEETGMQPKAFWVVPFVNMFYDAGWDSVNLSPMFAAEVAPATEPRLSDEHCEFGWYSYNDAVKKLVWPGQREGMRIIHDFILGDETGAKLTRIL